MAWHIVFGIEANVEALLSPTHLILATGMFLIMSSNFRAWWARVPAIGKPSLLEQLPMLFSLIFSLSMVTFMTQFAHFIKVYAQVPRPLPVVMELHQALGIAGYLLQTLLSNSANLTTYLS